MGWIASITVDDGLEENTERIVCYITGDMYIQLSGFFTTAEIDDLAAYLRSAAPHPRIEQHPPTPLPD